MSHRDILQLPELRQLRAECQRLAKLAYHEQWSWDNTISGYWRDKTFPAANDAEEARCRYEERVNALCAEYGLPPYLRFTPARGDH